jgi:hypothetical protein
MKGQIFTLDLIIGLILITLLLGSAYSLASYYSDANVSINTNANFQALYSSTASSFAVSNSTISAIDAFQNGGTASAVSSYIISILGNEIFVPYKITFYGESSYLAPQLPSTELVHYASPDFGNFSGVLSFTNLILVSNFTAACGGSCDYAGFPPGSVFPSQSFQVNAPDCTVHSPNGTNVLSLGWSISNNTPSGSCTIGVSSNVNNAPPNDYLVKAYSGATLDGETTLFVLAIDSIVLQIKTN